MITIEIDERTKAGKAILEMLRLVSKEKGITIIDEEAKRVPNAETQKILQENDRSRKGVKTFDSVEALFEELNS